MSVDLELIQLDPEEWKTLATSAHKICFDEDVPNDYDRIDFALLVRSEDGPCGFATISEINKYTAYMQDGGAFPNIEHSPYVMRAYTMIMNWLRESYTGIRTHVHSKNTTMIKMAMAVGLSITGTEYHDGAVYVNMAWEDKP